MNRQTVCSTRGCTTLVDRAHPCPEHGRPLNASWSKDRDWKAHNALRKYLKQTRGDMCERCKVEKWRHMHHVRPGDEPANVLALCQACHKAVDTHAR